MAINKYIYNKEILNHCIFLLEFFFPTKNVVFQAHRNLAYAKINS
jgi:hypothetical protein